MDVWSYLIGLLPAIVTGMVVFYLQRSQKKRDAKEEERARMRHLETRVQLDLQLATAKLSYAVAMAIKRGEPNGEVEEGIREYNKALNGFREFEREQLAKL